MPPNDKTVIFVNIRDFSKAAACNVRKIIKETKPSGALVVYFNSMAPAASDTGGMRMKLSEDYLRVEDYEKLDAYVINLVRTWYLVKGDDGRGIAECDGVNMGSLTEFDFHEFLSFRIKNLEVMKRVVDLERPARIVAIEDTGELLDAAKIIGSSRGIEVIAVNSKSMAERFRNMISEIRGRSSDIFYFSIFDPFIRMVQAGKVPDGPVLIDPRAHALLTGPHSIERLAFFPIEKGMSNRIYALNRGNTYISFDIPLSGRAAVEIKDKSIGLRMRWECIKNDPSFQKMFIYDGISIWGLVEKAISKFFNERFPRILNVMRQVSELHKGKGIRAIVFRGDGREKEKAIITAAKMLRIPTVYVTHGVLAENNDHDILYCTKTAVWGEADFDRYVSLGNSPSQLAITGSPKYDLVTNDKAFMSAEEVYERVGLVPGRDFIILATQPVRKFSSYNTYDETAFLTRCVLGAMKGLPGMQLVIKLHPFDDYAIYERILRETPVSGVFLIRDIDSLSLIKTSALLIAFNSTTALEAMMLDKPVIIINLGKREDTLPYVSKGGALGVYDAKDLVEAIKKALTNTAVKERLREGRGKIVSYYLHKLDGRASERVTELIKKTIGVQHDN